jgi:uncharacterized protein (DUF433 family)
MNNMKDKIVIDEKVCNGKPIIKGTRITVQTIIDHLSNGDDFRTLLKAYPALNLDDLKYCQSLEKKC